MIDDESRTPERSAADLAVRDDLTGLFNRRLLSEVFEKRWDELVAKHGRVAVVMIDLDGFKDVNDTYGHICGDAVLRATSRVLLAGFRTDDVIIRYGGDEFVVLLPGVAAADAARLGERVRAAMAGLGEDAEVREAGITAPVSFSIGVAGVPDDGEDPDEVLACADARLFADKRHRHPLSLSRERWRVAAVVGLLVGGVIVASLIERSPGSIPPRPNAAAAPASTGAPAPREAVLLAEIDALRRRLDERREAHAVAADTGDDQHAIVALQAQIRGLETRLAAARRGPTPTAVASQAALTVPTPGTATSTGTASTARPTPPRTAERPMASPVARSVVAPSPVPAPKVLPVLDHYEAPRYPEIARRMRREADVALRVVVDARGRVTSVERLGAPAGYGFDEAAREAAFRASFKPGTVGGVPATMTTTLTVRFRLREAR
jgi:TonB family protein